VITVYRKHLSIESRRNYPTHTLGSDFFHTCSYDGGGGFHQWKCLGEVMCTHEGTSSFILLDKWDKGCGGPYNLSGNHVDVLNFINVCFNEFASVSDRHPLLDNNVAFTFDTSMCNICILLIIGS